MQFPVSRVERCNTVLASRCLADYISVLLCILLFLPVSFSLPVTFVLGNLLVELQDIGQMILLVNVLGDYLRIT